MSIPERPRPSGQRVDFIKDILGINRDKQVEFLDSGPFKGCTLLTQIG